MNRFINIPFFTFLLQGIPEQIAVVALASVIANLSVKRNKLVLIGTGLALSVYLIRLFPLPFGIHTIIIILLLFIILTKLGGDFSLSLIASLISYLALILFEIASMSALMPLLHISTQTLLSDPMVRFLISGPQIALLFLSAVLVKGYMGRGEFR